MKVPILNLILDLHLTLEAYAINLAVISPVAPIWTRLYCSVVSQRKGDDVARKGSVASRRHNIS